MFFRRVFGKKETVSAPPSAHIGHVPQSPGLIGHVAQSPGYPTPRVVSVNDNRRGVSVLQLTPLWEYVVRTQHLPEDVNPSEVFSELSERLNDPEWQVRQHSLRVLIDVIPVLGSSVDGYMENILQDLINNLGHTAPAVRKGALDALNVYLRNSHNPEKAFATIIDIGLEQPGTHNALQGNVVVGLILSLPSLIYQFPISRNNPQYWSVVASAIKSLNKKVVQVTFQEVSLRVLVKIQDMIGADDFKRYMNESHTNGKRDFDLLCKVYGISPNNNLGDSGIDLHVPSSSESKESNWNEVERNIVNHNENANWNSEDSATDDDEDKDNDTSDRDGDSVKVNPNTGLPLGKVIMETEIKLDAETAVTMTLVEEQNPNENITDSEDESYGRKSAVMRVLTDSEIDEDFDPTRRTPRRVRFGGEIVKMRTPDSDTVPPSDAESELNVVKSSLSSSANSLIDNAKLEDSDTSGSSSTKDSHSSRSHIPIPIAPARNHPKDLHSSQRNGYSEPSTPVKHQKYTTLISTTQDRNLNGRSKSDTCLDIDPSRSPVHTTGRRTSRGDDILSPVPVHNEIEVIHNLQRSLTYSSNGRIVIDGESNAGESESNTGSSSGSANDRYKTDWSWENLEIIDKSIIDDLHDRDDWRNRLHGYESLATILNTPSSFGVIQPRITSLLQFLLSSERHPKVAETKRDVLRQVLTKTSQDVLDGRLQQILTGLCKHGGAHSITIAKHLMQKLSPAVVVEQLLSDHFLQARSAKFREHALQMVLFATMTFPSTEFDIRSTSRRVVIFATDRKRRVRQCALDTLAVLCQISSPVSILEAVKELSPDMREGDSLLSAVKARLSRKQLPTVGADGSVVYALRIASPKVTNVFGADVDWIAAGSGSVSPGSGRSSHMGYDTASWGSDESTQGTQNGYRDLASQLTAKSTSNGIVVGIPPNRHPNVSYSHGPSKGPWANRKSQELVAIGVGVRRTPDDSVQWTLVPVQNNAERNKRSALVMNNPVKLTNAASIQIKNKLLAQPLFLKLQSSTPKDNARSSYTEVTGPGADTSRIPVIQSDRVKTWHSPVVHSITADQYLQRVPPNSLKPGHNPHADSGSSDSPGSPQHYITTRNVRISKGESNAASTKGQVTSPLHADRTASEPRDSTWGSAAPKRKPSSPRSELQGPQAGTKVRALGALTETGQEKSTRPKSKASANTGEREKIKDSPKVRPSSPSEGSVQSTSSQGSLPRLFKETSRPVSTQTSNSYIARLRSNEAKPQTPSPNNEPPPPTRFSRFLQKVGSDEDKREWEEIKEKFVLRKKSPEDEEEPRQPNFIEERLHAALKKQVEEDKIKSMEEDDRIVEAELNKKPSIDLSNVKPDLLTNEGRSSQSSPRKHSKSKRTTPKKTAPAKEVELVTTNVEQPVQMINDLLVDVIGDVPDNTAVIPDEEVIPESTPEDLMYMYDEPPIVNENFQKEPKKISKESVRIAAKLNKPVVKVATSNSKKQMAGPQPFSNPREGMVKALTELEIPDWEKNISGLQATIRLIRHHPDLIEGSMHTFCMLIAKQVKNLRSQVSRVACQACSDMFSETRKGLDSELEELAVPLFQRTADTNKFLRADSNAALDVMCDNMSCHRVILVLTGFGAQHQNAVVRCSCARLLNRIVQRIGHEKVFNLNKELRDKILLTGAKFLQEGSLETRGYAKETLKVLIKHEHFNKILVEVVPARIFRNIEKILRNINFS